LDFPITS
jgi:hypothetical protein